MAKWLCNGALDTVVAKLKKKTMNILYEVPFCNWIIYVPSCYFSNNKSLLLIT